MNSKPTFLILCGDGINCEKETAMAFENANANAQIIHVNDLMESPKLLLNFDGLAFPGGFSFGDELGSGQVLAMKMKHTLKDTFQEFVAQKKPIIGICNGFQVQVRLGLLPFPNSERIMALASNESGTFINKWANMDVHQKSVCKWTTGLHTLDTLDLPARHGEGRVVFKIGEEEKIYNSLLENGQIALSYKENFNGSYQNIAGICDPSGLIFGLMPHPEAYIYEITGKNPSKNALNKANGQKIFENIVYYLNQK